MPALGLCLGLNLVLFILGHFSIWPSFINSHGYANFASDSLSCHTQALELAEHIQKAEWELWWEMASRFHTRLASIFYFLWGSWTGYSNLSLLPLNLGALFFTWLGWNRIISLLGGNTPKNSSLLFFLPTIVLHYTQLLRDPYYISLFIWWLSFWVSLFQCHDPKKHLNSWLMILLLSPFLFWVRERFWVTAQVMSLSWFILALILTLFRKHHLKWLIGVFLICLCLNAYSIYKYAAKNWFQIIETSENNDPQKKDFVFFYKIASLRKDFNKSYQQPSSIDNHIEFKNDEDVINYLPRAIQIGLLAPFPDMWWQEGRKSGRAGRLLSAFEMTLMWGVMVLTLCSFIFHSNKLEWLICFSAIAILCLALGYVVSNVGAIYRMRYVTWFIWLALMLSTIKKSDLGTKNNSIELKIPDKK